MSIYIAPEVESGLGPRTTAQLSSGRIPLPSVECYACGATAYPDIEDTTLSLLTTEPQPLTLFSHARCAPSRVLARGDLDPETITPSLAFTLDLQDQETVWNYMQAELVADDAHVSPMLGPGKLTRAQATDGIQTILDTAASGNHQVAELAALWRAAATEDMVYAGRFLWCIYEYPVDRDPRAGALGWLHVNMSVLRQLGFGGELPRTPAGWRA